MKILPIVGLLLSFTFHSIAQSSLLNYQETSMLIDGVQATVGQTQLNGELADIQKNWQKYIKTQLGEKMDEETPAWIIRKCVLNQVTDKRGDLMLYVFTEEEKVTLNVAYKLGYDVYLNAKQFPEEAEKMKDFVYNFVYEYYDAYLPDYIKSKEKGLKVLEKEHSKARKRLTKARKLVAKSTRKARSTELKLNKSEIKLTNTSDELRAQKISTKVETYQGKLATYQKTKSTNEYVMASQKELMDALGPKITDVQSLIASAKLTLIEVRSKIKTQDS